MITLTVQTAVNLKEKIQGLVGKDKPYALMIKTHFGIHTFGLKFPIDVLILDNDNKVVAMKKSLEPNQVFLWNPIYEKVIELPKGTIEEKAIRINDRVKVIQ